MNKLTLDKTSSNREELYKQRTTREDWRRFVDIRKAAEQVKIDEARALAATLIAKAEETGKTKLLKINMRTVNKLIAPDLLVQGNGYLYFVFDDDQYRPTTSIPVCWLRDQSLAHWLRDYARYKVFSGDFSHLVFKPSATLED